MGHAARSKKRILQALRGLADGPDGAAGRLPTMEFRLEPQLFQRAFLTLLSLKEEDSCEKLTGALLAKGLPKAP